MLLLLPFILNIIGTLAREPGLRIVGGRPVSITKRPFQVLLYRKTPIFVPGCGGSIIHRQWILTAAHCINNIPPNYLVIRAGMDDLDDDNTTQWFDIAKVIPHEEYDDSQWMMKNDIGLLKTKKVIEFSPRLQPIKVKAVSPTASSQAVISGFGVTEEGSVTMSKILREVTVTVLDRKSCVKILGLLTKSLGISESHFCAAFLDGGRDACQGDSGGPITIGDSLSGVVSWGIGCARRMIPAFYTDVAQFIPWIEEKITKDTKRMKKRKFSCRAN